MKVAIEGCCHGELDAIYSGIQSLEQRNGYKVDVLLICGDFQAIRNYRDLQCMAVPDKYRQLGEFWKYYTGEKVAPVLTLVIGGNHEASSYFWELYHGGWIAPKIYFLGHAGCVQLSSPTVFLSHDWPQGIEHHGDLRYLLRRKPHFRDDVKKGILGSPPLMDLLHTLKPDWWFAAHLHCRFEARVMHGPPAQAESIGQSGSSVTAAGENPDEIAIEDGGGEGAGEAAGSERPRSTPAPEVANAADQTQPAAPVNPDEIMLDDEVEQVASPPPPPPPQRATRFVALDKCLPRRQFLEIVDIPEPAEHQSSAAGEQTAPVLSFDPEWLAVTRAFHSYMPTGPSQMMYPEESAAREAVEKELAWVKEHVKTTKVEECQAFVVTAPPPNPATDSGNPEQGQQPPHHPNPQTQAFCSMLEIENKIDPR
ncbi:hypothetical protein EVJ58_g1673 [Rhodofomes roseus]|uniref:Lariat debranching enzyme C-terminal domain-containing protein n=1 Tax=Rhodofomes roseus TaxID=34475 RepID=A0A4Y9Z000_9APHY|nr:hypothetical protein EVJ58_g1673 [Rhodofomes roseus]